MKKVSASVLAAVLSLAGVQTSKADLLAAWDFINLPATTVSTATPATIASTVGTGSIDISAFGLGSPQGTNPERTSFAGTAVNNVFPGSDTSTTTGVQQSLALANSSANGKAVVFSFNMSGETTLQLSLATRGTSTGFDTHAWAWSTDGTSYTPLISDAANKTSAWSVETVNFGSVLDNVPTAFISLTLSGATSGSGNNRLDNIQLNTTPVPEPSTLALAALGGVATLVAFRRRR